MSPGTIRKAIREKLSAQRQIAALKTSNISTEDRKELHKIYTRVIDKNKAIINHSRAKKDL